jgi:hypothetical protein
MTLTRIYCVARLGANRLTLPDPGRNTVRHCRTCNGYAHGASEQYYSSGGRLWLCAARSGLERRILSE